MCALFSTGLIIASCVVIASADDDKAVAEANTALQGKWLIVDSEINGRKADGLTKMGMLMIFNDEAYMAERRGEIVVDGTWAIIDVKDKGDFHLDINTMRFGKYSTTPALLRVIDGKTIQICTSLPGTPRPTAFETTAGSRHKLLTLMRVE